MQLTLKDSLPFVTVTLAYRQADTEVPHVLVDTGSARTMFAADVVAQVGLIPEPEDTLLTVRGVGGAEVVFTRLVDCLQVGCQAVKQFEIEIGGGDNYRLLDQVATTNCCRNMPFVVSYSHEI